jgi:hypothetical protein
VVPENPFGLIEILDTRPKKPLGRGNIFANFAPIGRGVYSL